MQLKINNVAKIKEATINIDGITVIAGENNTGKSTIGKLLFAIFNSMNNMDEKIEQKRNTEIYQILDLLIQNYAVQNGVNKIGYRRKYTAYIRDFSEHVSENVENIQKCVEKIITDLGLFGDTLDISEFINECTLKLEAILNIPDKKIMTEVITRWFNKVFQNQMSPLMEEGIDSEVNLIIKKKELRYVFKENACIDWNTEFSVLHQAFYIDNPFIVDYMADRVIRSNMKITDMYLLSYLCKKEEDIFDGIFDTVMAKTKLDDVYSMLEKILEGKIIENQDGEYCLKSNQYNKPINIKNLSTGLKSFALIKKLLENGSLKEKDILILDEPEIHLHPEWQLAYAELIVLLQKKFDLTMIITTHSPYFLDAIDVFSAKYEMSDRVNYYLAENEGAVSYLHDVTENIDAIYKKLSSPMQKLENIRSGLV